MGEENKLSRLGKFLTAMRLIYSESFDGMAEKLGIEPEQLSAIEVGTDVLPDFVGRIRTAYGLDDDMVKAVEDLAESAD